MREIQLTQGQVAIVDDWWFDYLNQFKWQACWSKSSNSYYAQRVEGGRKNKKTICMHRIVSKTPKGMEADHRNHDTLDNREGNLRNVTHGQNGVNSRLRKDNKLREKYIRKAGNQFEVRFVKDKELVFEERFESLDIAKYVRDKMVKIIHGEFAYSKEQL